MEFTTTGTHVTQWVKDNLSDCTHNYDIWHYAKGYVDSLMKDAEVLSARNTHTNEELGLQLPRDVLLPPLCAQYQRHYKELAVYSHVSRNLKASQDI
ncbi:hypothetical protein CHS0354_010518 [Potamilus streckersoni]|uniref:Uncharacterized protein n=1 Tax=Potamilus streckersoni TaxID=2493646 RepID=A0AAE0S5X0_9BIVA|nr:hypothetical protein CHS0354_010518 [Potamilus streckersoni]